MNMNLALKGHKTRGADVIKLLEMLGGNNRYHINTTECNLLYTIREGDNVIIGTYPNSSISQIYTLEQFLEKFPYKIGDKVLLPEYESEVRIDDMKWNGVEILYSVFTDEVEWYSADELNDFNNTFITMGEKKTNQMSLANCDLDEVEIVLGDKFELVNREGKYYAVRKKPKYPKTYEECCAILNLPHSELTIDVPLHYSPTLIYLTKLLICRDAYWKIDGEEMGLGKPWQTAMQDTIWGITRSKDEVEKYSCHYGKTNLLEFPTEEMRDEFFENFKDLIERCKELL